MSSDFYAGVAAGGLFVAISLMVFGLVQAIARACL